MKIVIVLALIALAKATDFNLDLEEQGQKFVEKIKVDTEGNTEEYSVPKHGDRVAIDVLKDFTKGLKAAKTPSMSACYISELTTGDEIPAAVLKEMKLSGSKFPKKIKVEENMVLPMGEITAEEVGSKIVAHCKGQKLIKVIVLTKDNMDAVVTGMLQRGEIKAPPQGKRTILHSFPACTSGDVSNIRTCPPSRLGATCRFRRRDGRSCVYTVQCPRGVSGYDCRGTHSYSSLVCCNFTCM